MTTPHRHEKQEEVFVAMTDGQIAVDGDVRDVSAGGVVRVGPDRVRNLLNETDVTHVWLAFGAPPGRNGRRFRRIYAPGGSRVTGEPAAARGIGESPRVRPLEHFVTRRRQVENCGAV